MTHLSKYMSMLATAIFFLFLTCVLPGQTQEVQIRKWSDSRTSTDGGSIQWVGKAVGLIVVAILILGGANWCWAADDRSRFPHVDATVTFDQPPEWAVLQRQLIDQMNTSADVFIEKYLQSDGAFRYNSWGKLDDSYETFHNWPMFYTLGGDDRFLPLAKRQWETITQHFTNNGTVQNEFHSCNDWFHQGEGFQLFYALCLADPYDPKFMDRAQRFAGLYLNEYPGIKNYDKERKLVLSTRTGSTGPLPWIPDEPWEHIWTMDHYGLPFYDVPGIASFAALNEGDNMKKMAATA